MDGIFKKWKERKEALEGFLALATDNIKLDSEANYGEIVDILSKILSKDASINVCSVAAKCITQLAKGLRTKFGLYAATFVPVIFEKFKEKKALLRDPLIEAIDAIYPTTSIDAICDPIVAALGKPNPNIKIQTNQFLYRVFKTFNAQTAPKTVVKTLTPLIAKCTGVSDAEVREASFAALGAIMKAIGKSNAMKMLGDVANDKAKMERIDKFYFQAVEEEAQEEEAAKKAAAEQAAGSSHPAEASLSEATTQSTASSIAAPAAAVAEVDPWDFVDPVDILPKLPEKFEETVASKKWQERKEVLEVLLQLATDNIRLDPKANYGEIVATLTKVISNLRTTHISYYFILILSKDANINVCAVAAKCITQLARGLRSKFANHAPSIIEVIFEKFKEKKALLRDPLVEAIDAVYAATTIEAVSENVVAALGKPNPNIKIQTNLFLYRVFKAFNVQTAPKKIIKTLTPLIAKCTGESDAEAREAAFSALGAIMKAMGKNKFRLFVTTMLGDVANDKTKMERIEKFYNQAVEDAKKAIAQQAAGSSHPVEKDPNIGKIVECLKKSEKIDQEIFNFVRSSKEILMAFERFLKSADIAVIDKESTVTFENGLTLTITDSDHLYTKRSYQLIATGVKTVKFTPTAHDSNLLKAIINFGSPKNVSFGYQESANQRNVPLFEYDTAMNSWESPHTATMASTLIIRCFDSISTLECPASELVNYDFHGGLMGLNLLKVAAKTETEIRIVLQMKNIKAKRIEVFLTTLKPEFRFENLLLAFYGIKKYVFPFIVSYFR
uniref:TOG domain-containing protein n=1 Tax=Panagrolaimus davidi TaxID=227884 RepID=A0A914PB53_9BILA